LLIPSTLISVLGTSRTIREEYNPNPKENREMVSGKAQNPESDKDSIYGSLFPFRINSSELSTL